MQPCRTPFLMSNSSVSPNSVLTAAFYHMCRNPHDLQDDPRSLVIYTGESLLVVNETHIKMLQLFSGSFHHPSNVGNVISRSPSSFETSLLDR